MLGQPLGVGAPLLALADDLVVQHVERSEQRGRAVALVVVRVAARPFFIGGPGCKSGSMPASRNWQ